MLFRSVQLQFIPEATGQPAVAKDAQMLQGQFGEFDLQAVEGHGRNLAVLWEQAHLFGELGGLVAGSGFLKHLGIIERLAERCPLNRTSPNAAPVREGIHSFALSALVEGKHFCHVRWLTDDPAIATIMNLERVRGEDALPRLAKGMSVEQMRDWMQQPQSELYAALPERFNKFNPSASAFPTPVFVHTPYGRAIRRAMRDKRDLLFVYPRSTCFASK